MANGERSRQRATTMVVLIGMAAVLSGCTPKQSAMPLLVHVDDEGWIEASAPICADDRVAFAAVFVPNGDDVVEQSESQAQVVDRVVEFTLTDDAVERGKITEDLPLIGHARYGTRPAELHDLGRFRLTTSRYRVAVDLAGQRFEAGAWYLANGVAGTDDDASITPVNEDVGVAAITEWCGDKGGT